MILVNRGKCSFATKVYYGELAGAQVVVIVDYEKNTKLNSKELLVDDRNGILLFS